MTSPSTERLREISDAICVALAGIDVRPLDIKISYDEIGWLCDAELSRRDGAQDGWVMVPKDVATKAALWDDLCVARGKTKADPDDAEWKAIARKGNQIQAIKVCRALHSLSLREAKDCVEGYIASASQGEGA